MRHFCRRLYYTHKKRPCQTALHWAFLVKLLKHIGGFERKGTPQPLPHPPKIRLVPSRQKPVFLGIFASNAFLYCQEYGQKTQNVFLFLPIMETKTEFPFSSKYFVQPPKIGRCKRGKTALLWRIPPLKRKIF